LFILGIETATQICSVALTDNTELVAEYRLNIKNAHERVIAGAIDNILSDAKTRPQQLSGIAVSIGPGSFTGLRIGLSIAKGIALPYRIALTGVNTLQALAAQCPVQNGTICAVILSRADEFYHAVYERRNFQDELIQDVGVASADEIRASLPAGTFIIGQPYSKLKDLFPDNRFNRIPESFSYPSGFQIACIGYEQIASGRTADITTMEPYYYHDFVAGKPRKSSIAN